MTSSNRHVPLILGAACLGVGVWLIVGFSGWWRYIPALPLLWFGWASLKTGLFAKDTEIQELTGHGPASDDTMQKFKDRL